VLLPILNLVTLLIAGATAYLATNDLAAKAATQPSFAQALNAMTVEAYNFQSNSLAQFVKMSPQGGHTGCGNDLFVLATNIGGGGIQSSTADQSLTSNIDTTKNMYEMQVVSSYSVSPLISLSALPLLGSIPGLGQPITLSFAASRPIEHPGGMQIATDTGGGGGGVTPFHRINATPPGALTSPTAVTWRNPNIFQLIQSNGQTVVSVNVFTVQASNTDWTPSGVQVLPGQKVYFDTQAVGFWGMQGSTGSASGPISTLSFVDANGIPLSVNGTGPLITANFWSLIGVLGVTGPVRPNTPHSFLVGDSQYNYQPPGTGQLFMTCNNCSSGLLGAQMVRVIVVQ
jgi:hypothetical protein